ncbi:Glutathione S-transferase [Mycena kentingensis (nom. inval.)]|nr:Glutathione S-transferase [Mycena kentingensis (nom. inval.)]
MVLKLYTSQHPGGGSAVVATLLAAKKIPFEVVLIDTAAGEQKTPEFLKIHPFGQVPVLDDAGFILHETRAICRYIERKYSENKLRLAPAEHQVQNQALFDQAVSVEAFDFFPPVYKVVNETLLNMAHGIPTNQVIVDKGLEQLSTCLDVYEGILGRQKYTAGDKLTLVDLYHLAYAPVMVRFGIEIMSSEARPNVARWWKELVSFPAWAALQKAGKISSILEYGAEDVA